MIEVSKGFETVSKRLEVSKPITVSKPDTQVSKGIQTVSKDDVVSKPFKTLSFTVSKEDYDWISGLKHDHESWEGLLIRLSTYMIEHST